MSRYFFLEQSGQLALFAQFSFTELLSVSDVGRPYGCI
jgi:hypothetical protein